MLDSRCSKMGESDTLGQPYWRPPGEVMLVLISRSKSGWWRVWGCGGGSGLSSASTWRGLGEEDVVASCRRPGDSSPAWGKKYTQIGLGVIGVNDKAMLEMNVIYQYV